MRPSVLYSVHVCTYQTRPYPDFDVTAVSQSDIRLYNGARPSWSLSFFSPRRSASVRTHNALLVLLTFALVVSVRYFFLLLVSHFSSFSSALQRHFRAQREMLLVEVRDEEEE